MPARGLSVRKIREVLRLQFELGLDNRQSARSCSIPCSTVANQHQSLCKHGGGFEAQLEAQIDLHVAS